ncbi:MAG: acyltransferase [Proteobacteria bacterium]|nr:acyltransferase [Pseudomonadota bacterium]
MKSIAHLPMPAEAHVTPVVASRNLALDRARTFLTLIVLIHHAVIPYTHFGHTDEKSWIGFDAIVLATDSFFMAMFFFLSGLFVWPSLGHKAPAKFIGDRLLRLGLPFALAAVTIIPIAYYALALQQGSTQSFADFWWQMITVGPWPSGPLWFVWVLLAFDLSACLLYRLAPWMLDHVNRLSIASFERPERFFIYVVTVTAILYVPSRLYFQSNTWFEFGPFAVQKSRVLLYAAYFFIGAGIGAANFSKGLLSVDGRLAKSGPGWIVVTLIPYCLLWVLIYIKREVLGNPDVLPGWYEPIYSALFVAFSAGIIFAILAYFLRFKRSGFSILDPMQHDAYGIFLVHYAYVLWLQYWMFDMNWPAILKAFVAFIGTLLLSWATTAALRQIPGATRVL